MRDERLVIYKILNINFDRPCCMPHIDGSKVAGDDSGSPS